MAKYKLLDVSNIASVDNTSPLGKAFSAIDQNFTDVEAHIAALAANIKPTTTTTTTATVVGSAPNPMAPIVVTAPQGYKAANIDDGVELSLDTLAVQLPASGTRSLQFRVTSGTMSVNISGECYWSNNNYAGNYEARYWNGNTLNTTYQQIFGWSFPWAGDKAVYNVQDLTNRRFYRITLIIGGGYKRNTIIMERMV